jgi:hypothetical protein
VPDALAPAVAADDLSALALAKLSRVLGPERGGRVFAETLAAARMTTLSTADDLYAFAEHLSRRGGIEAAVGGLLSVAAVIRGAAHTPK